MPEEWQVKQFICQMVTTVKQKQKATAGVQVLAPDARREHFGGHLLDILLKLPGNMNVLANDNLSFAVDLSIIKQMDVLKKIVTSQDTCTLTLFTNRSILVTKSPYNDRSGNSTNDLYVYLHDLQK